MTRIRGVSRVGCLAASVVTAAVVLLSATPAAAGPGGGWVTCGEAGRPACEVGATAPGSSAATARAPSAAQARHGSGNRQCHDVLGKVTPCYDPAFGSMGSDGCYYKPIAAPPVQEQAAWGAGAGQGPGGWYRWTCPGLPGTGGGQGWVAGRPAGLPALVDPAVLAQQAVSQLELPRLVIEMSPGGTQVVRIPTWYWVDAQAWRPRSATAAVPGVSVTATATPSRVVWSTGDGGSVTCSGPGTPWRSGIDPDAASPTCGHTYLTGSSKNPGGAFTVTATVSWTVAWNGAGQSGTVPGLTTTGTATIRVVEVRAVVAAPE